MRLVTPNQVRPWKKGEFFVEDNGAVIQGTWDCDAAHLGDPTGFGFRHWICEPIPAEQPMLERLVLERLEAWVRKCVATTYPADIKMSSELDAGKAILRDLDAVRSTTTNNKEKINE